MSCGQLGRIGEVVQGDHVVNQCRRVEPARGNVGECCRELVVWVTQGEPQRQLSAECEHGTDTVGSHHRPDNDDLGICDGVHNRVVEDPGFPHRLKHDRCLPSDRSMPRCDRGLVTRVNDDLSTEPQRGVAPWFERLEE